MPKNRSTILPKRQGSHGKEVNVNEWDNSEYEGSNDEDLEFAEMVSMIKEYEKRKTTKTSSRSTAFNVKKLALFQEARKDADTILRDGIAHIEQFQDRVRELKSHQLSRSALLSEIAMITRGQDDSTGVPLTLYHSIFQEIGYHRADEVNEISATIECHSTERQNSRRRLIRSAKSRLDEGFEQQKIATDASILIKHYKSLLRS